mmetsp:Transcript_78203/g.156480  ORF Transcript_78203/g.156480 Transcript_78203/m.156480 type:complete len:236 (+) Transcript_78203:759-1466(+)
MVTPLPPPKGENTLFTGAHTGASAKSSSSSPVVTPLPLPLSKAPSSPAASIEFISSSLAACFCLYLATRHPIKRSTARPPPTAPPKLAMSAPPSLSPPPLSLLPESAPGDEVVVVTVKDPPAGVVPPPVGVLATGEAVGGAATAGMAVGDGRGTTVVSPWGTQWGAQLDTTPERLAVVTPLATEAVSTSALARDEAWLTKAADASVVETEVPSAAWSDRPAAAKLAFTVKLAVHS